MPWTFKIWNEEIMPLSWHYYGVTETSHRHYVNLFLVYIFEKRNLQLVYQNLLKGLMYFPKMYLLLCLPLIFHELGNSAHIFSPLKKFFRNFLVFLPLNYEFSTLGKAWFSQAMSKNAKKIKINRGGFITDLQCLWFTSKNSVGN